MKVQELALDEIVTAIDTEEKAQEWFWRYKFHGKDFQCPRCQTGVFYTIKTRGEVRKCKKCGKHVRLRVGTMLEKSKVPLLTWIRALSFAGKAKHKFTPTNLKRNLQMKSYGTMWVITQKIRQVLDEEERASAVRSVLDL